MFSEITLLNSLIPEPINNLLIQYQDVFFEPNQLPPPRSHDQSIPLKEGAQPVNLRPYKYPYS